MTISNSNKITYQDVIDMIVNNIVNNCENVGVKPTFNDASATLSISGYYVNNGYPSSNHTDYRIANSGTITSSIKVNDSFYTNSIKSVSAQTIKDDFNTFLTERGIKSKASTKMSIRSLLNLLSNAAIFIKTRLVAISSSFNNSSNYISICYVQNSYTVSTNAQNNENAVDSTFTVNNLTDMCNALLAINNIHNITYSVTMTSSCSSSSSSSSSCSSSSSSSCSSSYFIAFMKLGI